MKEFAFKVNLTARVRVIADDESSARQVVPSILGAPSSADITLANQGSEILWDAAINSIDFFLDKEIRLVSSKSGS